MRKQSKLYYVRNLVVLDNLDCVDMPACVNNPYLILYLMPTQGKKINKLKQENYLTQDLIIIVVFLEVR